MQYVIENGIKTLAKYSSFFMNDLIDIRFLQLITVTTYVSLCT